MSRAWVVPSAAAALLAAVQAGAQPLLPEPLDLPPVGYAPDEYIDGAGCAFLRVEIAGETVWAPRYSATGAQLCGLTPSFADDPAVVPPPPPAIVEARPTGGLDKAGYYVQAGAFGVQANIERVQASFAARGWPTAAEPAGRLTVVYAGPFEAPEQAAAALRAIRQAGMPDAYLVVQD